MAAEKHTRPKKPARHMCMCGWVTISRCVCVGGNRVGGRCVLWVAVGLRVMSAKERDENE